MVVGPTSRPPQIIKKIFLLQYFNISEGQGAERRNEMFIFAVSFAFFRDRPRDQKQANV